MKSIRRLQPLLYWLVHRCWLSHLAPSTATSTFVEDEGSEQVVESRGTFQPQ